jgi:hypothetical protein
VSRRLLNRARAGTLPGPLPTHLPIPWVDDSKQGLVALRKAKIDLGLANADLVKRQWRAVERLGDEIYQLGAEWTALAGALIEGARNAEADSLNINYKTLTRNMCRYCFRPAHSGGICKLCRPPRRPGNARNAYGHRQRFAKWAINERGMELSLLIQKECRTLRERLRRLPENSTGKDILEALPNVASFTRASSLEECVANLFGADLADLYRQPNAGMWWPMAGSRLVYAEAYKRLEHEYHVWVNTERRKHGAKGGYSRKWTSSDIAHVRRLRAKGLSLRKIEAQTGIPYATLSRRLQAKIFSATPAKR